MKNPLVVFTGAALATLAALAGLKMTDWPAGAPEASKATEVTSEAPKPSSGEAEKPAEKPAETAAVQPSEPPQAEAPKAETPASETPAPETPAAATAKPELDTVRVEADGQAVVAGRAEPGAEVSLKLGDKVLGKGMANADGAWVVVPDSPLPKGAHELTIEQKSADGATSASEKSIAVAVPEKPGQQAMVALTEPGAATKVLQAGGGTEQPAPEQAEKPAEIAQAEKPAEPAQAEKPVDITPQQTAEASPAPQPEQAPAASAPVAETTPPSAGEQPAAEQPAGETVQKTTEAPPAGEVVQKSTEAPAAAEPTQKPAENAGAPAAEPPSQTQEMAAVETKPAEPAVGATQPAETVAPKAAEPPAKTADVPLRLDAVDYNDKGDIIFSGRAKPGTAVRLYVDNGSVGDAVVDSAGNWSFAGNDIIAPGTHMLRADQIDGSGKVMARIELPFQREDAAAVAALNAPAQPEPQPAPQPEATQAQSVPQPTQPETTQAESAPQPAQPEKTEAQPAAPQTAEVAKAEPEPVTPAPSAPQPATEQQPAEQPSTGQQPAESQAPEKTEEVAAAPQPEPEAKPAEPDKPRSGKVVIQPGNNLWKLSRVIYGRGINFTVIYDANKEQIRDPDLIYPGQIFAIPNATPPESIDPKRREPLTSAEGGAAQ